MPMASCRVTIPRSPDPVEMIAIGAQELPMELAPPRMFGCTRCQTQVFICSDCDRGQIYCGTACSRTARAQHHREADRRYQQSRKGRFTHAARARRYRRRQKAAHNVTDRVHPAWGPMVHYRRVPQCCPSSAPGPRLRPRRQLASAVPSAVRPPAIGCAAGSSVVGRFP